MSKKYTYDEMEKLSQKIQKIKKKKNLEEIRDIIIDNNSELNITENSYGIYLCFNQLTPKTFQKLEKYVKNYFDIEKHNKTSSTYNIPYSSTNEEENTKYLPNDFLYDQNSRLKFSNKEKNLIKKRLYDKALKINSEINEYEKNCQPSEESTNNIFLKKSKKVDKK